MKRWLVMALLVAAPVSGQVDTATVRVYDRADLRITIAAEAAGGGAAPCERTATGLACRAFRGDVLRFGVVSVVDTVSGDDITSSVAVTWATDDANAVTLNPVTGEAEALNRRGFRVWPVVAQLVGGIGFLLDAGNTPPRVSPGGYGSWFAATGRPRLEVPQGTYYACVYWQDAAGVVRAKSRRALVGWHATGFAIHRVDAGPCPDELVGSTALPEILEYRLDVVELPGS